MSSIHWTNYLLTIAMMFALGCGRKKDAEKKPQPEPRDEFGLTETDKTWWIEKASRTLRFGKGPTDTEIAALSGLSYDSIVDTLMADPLFFETVLDFNYYFYGFKSDKLAYPNPEEVSTLFFNWTRIPQAVNGAHRIMQDEDYFDMFDSTKVYQGPLSPVFNIKKMTFEPAISKSKRFELYEKRRADLIELVEFLDGVAEGEAPDLNRYCELASAAFGYLGDDQYFLNLPSVFSQAVDAIFQYDLMTPCYMQPPEGSPDPDPEVPQEVIERAKATLPAWDKIVAIMKSYEPDQYRPTSVGELRELNLAELGLADEAEEMSSDWFWSGLPNSSTSFNRKRANYILKRFFCDDLTPVNIVLPESHGTGADRHGSDPGCQSCHYKLDPVAGFFRYHGSGGEDYSGRDTIYFDDGASKNLAEYLKEWKTDDKERPWNVGFIRSLSDPSLNEYTSNPKNPKLSDLFALIKTAPEVKQCLVRRMATYVLGEGQAIDPGYLDELTAGFVEPENTSAGFRETFKNLVLSATFRAEDPESEICYDRASGAADGERPPCKVDFILQRHCAQCHSSSASAGGLDLTSWQNIGNGEYGFSHLGEGGEQLTRGDSFQRIYDRLTTSDADLRMPLNKHMDTIDRDALFRWFSDAVAPISEGEGL